MGLSPAWGSTVDSWQPSGKWNFDLSDAACMLGRAFSSGSQQLTLGFRTEPPSKKFTLVVVLPDALVGHALVGENPVTVSAPNGSPAHGIFSVVEKLDSDLRRVRISFDRADLDQLASARSLSVEGVGSDLTIDIDGPARAADLFQRCEDDLLTRWKIGRPDLATLPEPVEELRSRLRADDYPLQEIRENHEGVTSVLLLIDERGKSRQCRVVASSTKALDEQTCKLLQERYRYRPATDRSGHPAAAWLRINFHWNIPRG